MRFFKSKKKEEEPVVGKVISGPTDFQRHTHVSFDKEKGCFVGLPPAWQQRVEELGLTQEEIGADQEVIVGLLSAQEQLDKIHGGMPNKDYNNALTMRRDSVRRRPAVAKQSTRMSVVGSGGKMRSGMIFRIHCFQGEQQLGQLCVGDDQHLGLLTDLRPGEPRGIFTVRVRYKKSVQGEFFSPCAFQNKKNGQFISRQAADSPTCWSPRPLDQESFNINLPEWRSYASGYTSPLSLYLAPDGHLWHGNGGNQGFIGPLKFTLDPVEESEIEPENWVGEMLGGVSNSLKSMFGPSSPRGSAMAASPAGPAATSASPRNARDRAQAPAPPGGPPGLGQGGAASAPPATFPTQSQNDKKTNRLSTVGTFSMPKEKLQLSPRSQQQQDEQAPRAQSMMMDPNAILNQKNALRRAQETKKEDQQGAGGNAFNVQLKPFHSVPQTETTAPPDQLPRSSSSEKLDTPAQASALTASSPPAVAAPPRLPNRRQTVILSPSPARPGPGDRGVLPPPPSSSPKPILQKGPQSRTFSSLPSQGTPPRRGGALPTPPSASGSTGSPSPSSSLSPPNNRALPSPNQRGPLPSPNSRPLPARSGPAMPQRDVSPPSNRPLPAPSDRPLPAPGSGGGAPAATPAPAASSRPAAPQQELQRPPSPPKGRKLELADPKRPTIAGIVSKEDPEELYSDMAKIGEGASGKVYSATHKPSSKQVAIKQMELMRQPNPAVVVNEMVLMSKCDHPHIVRYVDSYLVEGTLWVSMEFVDGEDLTHVISSEERLEEDVIANMLHSMTKALNHLHQQGICHRDIKSDNVMVSIVDGVSRLTDFGFGCQLFDDVDNGKRTSVVGTSFWMAPEVVKRTPYDTKADVWSLGALAFELVQKDPPYFGMPHMKCLYQIIKHGLPPLTKEVSPELADFIAKCCQTEPEARPTCEELLSHPFLQNPAPNYVIKALVENARVAREEAEDMMGDEEEEDEYYDDYY